MSTRRVVLLILVLVGAAAGLALWGGPVDEDEAVRRVIHQVAEAAEDSNNHRIQELIHSDYSDPAGLSKKALQGVLARQFLTRGRIVIVLGPIDVARDGDTATASFDAVIVEGVEGFGLDGDGRHFTVDLVREDGVWLILGSDNSDRVLE